MFTLSPELEKRVLERRNTIDIRRHRVFSTRVEVRPREKSIERKEERKVCAGGRDGVEDQPTSWIASEILSTANIQALGQFPEIVSGGNLAEMSNPEEMGNVIMDECDEEYHDIESLIGGYFEDIGSLPE